ncbi:MAG: hypothetical protein PHZ21_03415 [Candidatus Bipolaricaulis sp.]|nr:hypothetical protein [Candidatus Bipolaricaulis sp.]MDY0341239.1 hypothetical protein [Coriobacteriia bacterium]
MTATEATAEVFWTAFKALPKKEQEAVIARLLRDEEFAEDLLDIALIAQARREPGEDVPLRDYLAHQGG